MNDAERIELFRSYCQFSYYPPALTEAACDYLAGQGSLEQVRQYARPDLPNIFTIKPSLLNAWQFGKHAPISQGSLLDALDCRLIDVCRATDQVLACLQGQGYTIAFQHALGHLVNQGMTPQALLQQLTGFLQQAFGQSRHIQMVQLLLAAKPPALEQAWSLVEEFASKEEPANVNELGQCVGLLFKAAPEGFTARVRQLAEPDSHASMSSRLLMVEALLEHNPTAHYDLAMGVMRDTIPSRSWSDITLRREIVERLFLFDPLRTLPLLTELVLALESWETWRMLQLLAQAPFDQARPHLQRCVAEGSIASASQALKTLLSQQWNGCQEYVPSLLAHHAKRIRREATAWLVPQGEAVLDGIIPFLTHTDSAIRLSAIDALAAIGGERALAILAARLPQEKRPKIRQAIFDVVGLPASQQYPDPLTQTTLTARAEATLQYVYKPTPRWFVVAEVPAPLWANNEPVPPAVLRYLLYRQSFVQAPGTLDNEVSQALTLLNRSTTGSLATYLVQGWIARGNNAKEAWCLPLICAMGDDLLIYALSLRVEDWYRDNRRKLAIRIIQAMPLFERQAAIQELRDLAKRLRRGVVKTAAKETLAAVAP
ncbi:MAG TPA: HEAT repeat domain-containing protein [Ktedonobacterales bacterium]|jgi:hypothetical protein